MLAELLRLVTNCIKATRLVNSKCHKPTAGRGVGAARERVVVVEPQLQDGDGSRAVPATWRVLDGTDGAAPGVEHAFTAALAGIDAIYAIEHLNAYNADVASPAEIQDFWDKRGQLPGFAIGT